MSIAALNWAWGQKCPNATSKLVLLALADKANEDGECWPGMDTVAEMAGVSVRQVSTHLSRLSEAGLIEKRRRRTALGHLGRYVFHLSWTSSGSQLPVGQEKSTSGSTPPVEEDRQWKPAVVTTGSPASSATGSPPQHKEHPSKSNPKGTSGAKPPGNHQQLFQALAKVCGVDPSKVPRTESGRYGKAAKDLVEIEATPRDVLVKARRYREKWPGIDITPTGLVANWGLLDAKPGRDLIPDDACRECGQQLDKHDGEVCAILAKAG